MLVVGLTSVKRKRARGRSPLTLALTSISNALLLCSQKSDSSFPVFANQTRPMLLSFSLRADPLAVKEGDTAAVGIQPIEWDVVAFSVSFCVWEKNESEDLLQSHPKLYSFKRPAIAKPGHADIGPSSNHRSYLHSRATRLWPLFLQKKRHVWNVVE